MHRVYRLILSLVVAGLLAGPVAAQRASAAPPARGGVACPVAGGATVVLDPGHGGFDSGATATLSDGTVVLEKDLNLAVANIVEDALAAQGITVALTRSGDTALGNSERGEIANACRASVLVLIHFNSSSDPTVDYTKTFWGKKRKDLDFSTHMNAALATGISGVADGGVGQFAHGALLQATMPSTLAETVFLSNPAEAEALREPYGPRAREIAAALAGGIASWSGI